LSFNLDLRHLSFFSKDISVQATKVGYPPGTLWVV